MGIRIKLIRKRGSTKLRVRHKIKHQKGTTRIKNFKNSKIKYTAKLKRKSRRKPLEETFKIQDLNGFEVDICAGTSPVAGQKPSHALLFDKVSGCVARFKYM
jgi:hypothetical protein